MAEKEQEPMVMEATAAENESDQSQTQGQAKAEYTPGPNAVDISPGKDGGLYKEIKREGIGEDHPMTGDTVYVHYVGTLPDGTKFDSSRDRGQQFDFTLGKGSVIKGWDVGVATMKRGELATLTCRSDFAYGDDGSPPKIPPKATLLFEVELFDWKGEDLSSDKDGGILRTILKQGEGYQHPNEGASCEVHIIGKHEGRVFEDRDVTLIIGEASEANVVEGVETALKKFKQGECSKLRIEPAHAYGSEGNKDYNIPGGAVLDYEVSLKSFEKAKENWEMEAEEKLEQSQLVKDKGTKYFKEGKYNLAKKYYAKITAYLEQDDTLEGDNKEKRNALMLAGYLNTAMCCLKLGENLDAVHSCEKALEMDENSEKGLFRRATAHMNMKNYEEAVADFNKVLSVDPDNKAAKNQITVAQHKIRQEKEREKKLYAGMFQKFAAMDAKNAPKEETKMEEGKDSEKAEQNGEQTLGSKEEQGQGEGEAQEVPMEETTAS